MESSVGDSARWVQRTAARMPALPYSAFPSSPIGTSQNLLQEWASIRPRPILSPSGMPGVLISIPAAPKRVLSPSAP